MKIWQFERAGKSYTVSCDPQKTPPVVLVNDKPVALTPKLTQKGQAYNFMVNKHQATIQMIQTDAGIRVSLLIDGERVQSHSVSQADTPMPKLNPDYDGATTFKRKQIQDDHRQKRQKNAVRQIIPDWAWVSIIGILFIPAFSRLQMPSLILAGIGFLGVVAMANIPKMKEIHRFAFTIMWMCFCWAAFVILSSRGIIKVDNLPLF
ncbi:MAG: hypothetical protein MUE54_06225 [Anaerolineae bacterium]|jgi:hypothetical protein|nr:hypothetical protein [Anaerolineae bacterium]